MFRKLNFIKFIVRVFCIFTPTSTFLASVNVCISYFFVKGVCACMFAWTLSLLLYYSFMSSCFCTLLCVLGGTILASFQLFCNFPKKYDVNKREQMKYNTHPYVLFRCCSAPQLFLVFPFFTPKKKPKPVRLNGLIKQITGGFQETKTIK